MANYNGSLKAVDCHIHSVRYDTIWCLRVELAANQMPHQDAYDVAATPIRVINA